jgi:hypothetical protein
MDVPVDLAIAAAASVSITGPECARGPGRLVECTWSICQTHRRQYKKASVIVPPIGSSSTDRICGAPGAAADLTVRSAAPAAEPSRREVVCLEALVAVDRDSARRMTARAIDMPFEAQARDVADRGDGQRLQHKSEAMPITAASSDKST